MDKIKSLNYFKRVAELKSFSKAASDLNIPVSSISRRIKNLEKMLNVELFHRTTRSVALTEFGELYYSNIIKGLAALADADSLISEHLQEPNGLIRISSSPAFGELVLSSIIRDFQQEYPKITFDLDYSDELKSLNNDPFDIAIRVGYPPDEHVMAKQLSKNEFKLLVSPKLLKQFGEDIDNTRFSFADFENLPCLIYRGPNGTIPWWGLVDGEWQKIKTKHKLTSNNGRVILDGALAGNGFVYLPEWSVVNYINNGKLVEVQTDFEVSVSRRTDLGIYILYRKTQYSIPKIRLCVDYIVKNTTVK